MFFDRITIHRACSHVQLLDGNRRSGYASKKTCAEMRMNRPAGPQGRAMQPFYQGKIDNFCAIYAVLNALQVLFRITPLHARTIFSRTLLECTHDLPAFQDILEHHTDYVSLVDTMLNDIRLHEFPQLRVEKPFVPGAPREEIWETLRSCACPSLPRVAVFRFLRMIPPEEKPYADHWTVGHSMDAAGLHLLDCSMEAGGLYCISFSRLIDREPPPQHEYIIIPSESVRILSTSGAIPSPV